jgi:DNA end-binding protein Ku
MPKPGRAYWKGFLRLSLVSIPVEIYNAIDSTTDIQFNQIHKPTGKRINYTKTVKGVGPVEAADIVKGYEIEKDVYVTLEPHEIDAIRLESKKTLDLQQFIDVSEIDPRYFERPYFIVPADEHAAEGYLVIRQALLNMKKMGLGQITMAGREYVVAVGVVDKGLVMELLRYSQELRQPSAYFYDLPDLKLDKEMVSLATELIRKKAAPFQPERFKDSYAVAMKAMIEEKAKGHRITAKPEPEAPQGNVIDLMAALKSSLKAAASQPMKEATPEPKKKIARKSGRG